MTKQKNEKRKYTEKIFFDIFKAIINSKIFEQLFGFKIDINSVQFSDTVFKVSHERRIDIGFTCIVDKSSHPIFEEFMTPTILIFIHIEIQLTNDSIMHLRMHNYWNVIKKNNDLPILQFVIYLGNEKLNMIDSINELGNHFKYYIIDINNIDCSLLASNEATVILSILAKNGLEPENIVTVLNTIKNIQDLNLRKQKLVNLFSLASLRKCDIVELKEKVEEEIMSIDIVIEENALYKWGYQKAEEKYKAEAEKAKTEIEKVKATAEKAKATAEIKAMTAAVLNLHQIKKMEAVEIAKSLKYPLDFVVSCIEQL